MDTKEIRELIELVARCRFRSFEIQREGFRMRMVRDGAGAPATAAIPASPAAPGAVVPESALVDSDASPASAPAAADRRVEVRSPIVGTFFTSAGPDSAPFVHVGSVVRKGQTVCIVEAMKVMNEIESEYDGEVVEILATNAQPVEFGQALFRLRQAG